MLSFGLALSLVLPPLAEPVTHRERFFSRGCHMAAVAELKVRFVRYVSETDPVATPEALLWSGLAALLSDFRRTSCLNPCTKPKKTKDKPKEPPCPRKFGPAWSPVVLDESRHRGNAHIVAMDAMVVDLDGLAAADFWAHMARLAGLQLLAHSTHSHTPPDDSCYRLVLALSRPLLAKEIRAFREKVITKYALKSDVATKDESRLFFLPSAPHEATPEFYSMDGVPLDVDALLLGVELKPLPRLVESLGPLLPPEGASDDMAALRARVKMYKGGRADGGETARRAMIKRVLAGEALVPELHDNGLTMLAGILARLLFTDFSIAAVQEFIRPSVHAMGWEDGDEHGLAVYAEKHERMLGMAVAERKEQAEDKARRDVQRQRWLQKMYHDRGFEKKVPPPAVAGEDPPPEDPDEWKAILRRDPKTNEVMPIISNLTAILLFDPRWAGVLRLDKFALEITAEGNPLGEDRIDPDELALAVQIWFEQQYGIVVSKASTVVGAIRRVAYLDSFDPIVDYYEARRGTWDGIPRIEKLFTKYFGAPIVDEDGKDISRFLARAGKRFMVGLTARALEPGCKLDTVYVLEGDQDVGKSTALNILGGRWFAELHTSVKDKDSLMATARSWLTEMSELTSLKRSDTSAMKGFLSSRLDRFRPPYGANLKAYPRRMFLVGTTNDDRYLIDTTTNRRYIPVRCGGAGAFDLDALEEDRDQIYAEALAVFEASATCAECHALARASRGRQKRCAEHRYWNSTEENSELTDMQRGRLNSSYDEAILAWMLDLAPEKRPESVTVYQVLTTVLELRPDAMEKNQTAIALALQRLGWDGVRPRDGKRRQRVYLVPESVRAAPRVPGFASSLNMRARADLTVVK
jgi:hypothetical protein